LEKTSRSHHYLKTHTTNIGHWASLGDGPRYGGITVSTRLGIRTSDAGKTRSGSVEMGTGRQEDACTAVFKKGSRNKINEKGPLCREWRGSGKKRHSTRVIKTQGGLGLRGKKRRESGSGGRWGGSSGPCRRAVLRGEPQRLVVKNGEERNKGAWEWPNLERRGN